MSYCLNPNCRKPQNPNAAQKCANCASNLLLKNQYRAIRPMGEGTFTRTFLAEDIQRPHNACLIEQFCPLPQIQGNAEAMAKVTQLFEREAKVLLEVGEQYPQLPSVYAYFEQDKYLYVVKQYIEGQNLWQDLQEQGAYNEHQIRELLHDMLPVLQLLHKRQIIHRQIKPTNIIRRNSESVARTLREPKYTPIDLGISRQLTDARLTRINTKPSTESYLPIEQLRTGKAFPASDLYSLGVVCIQMLTQAKLEELYDPQEGRWVWREYLRSMGRDVSEELSLILDKLLQDLVKERYQSASEVLRDFYDSASKRVRTGTAQTRLTPELQQKTQGWRCVQTLAKHTDTVTCVAFSRDGQTLATASADHTINLSHWESGKLLHRITGHTDTVTSVVFSPDSKLLASGSADKTIKIWQTDTGNLLHTLTGHSVTVFSVAFSPDGQILASGSGDGTIKLWYPGSGKLLEVLTGHSDFVETVAFSRDGQFLASGSWDNTIKIWNVSSAKLLHTLTGHSASVWSIAISPDAQSLASNSGDNTIKIWHIATGQLIRTITSSSDSAWSIAYSPDGQILASDSGDNSIKIWHIPTSQVIRTLSGHSSQVRCIAFGHQGKTIATGSDDMTVKIWQCD